MSKVYWISVTYDASHWPSLDDIAKKIAGKHSSGSGMGCGERDLDFDFRNRAAAERVRKRFQNDAFFNVSKVREYEE